MKPYLTILAICVYISVSAQQQNARRLRNFNHENGIAIREFDPVSYFKGKPAKGTSANQHTYNGITYYFASAENVEEFKKSPAKYEPAYGGWCAYSMGVDGQRIKIDPSTYKIINGKVYLFYNFNKNNTLLKWNANEKKLKAAADQFWEKKMH